MINKNYVFEYHDMFNKYNLIKKINPNYVLCYDNKNKLFIIINSANHDEICLKFANICTDIEKILKKTSTQNSNLIFEEIENNNKNLELNKINHAKNILSDSIIETQKYLKRTNKILPSDINKILGVKDV